MYGSPFLQQNNKKANCVFLLLFIFYLTIQTPIQFWEKNAEKNSELQDLILFFFTIPSLHLQIFFYWIEFTSCNSVFFLVIYVMD